MLLLDNKDDIITGDVFWLNYYGINIFLGVSKTMYDQVAVFEIKKYKYWEQGLDDYADVINDKFRYETNPLLVTGKNNFMKTEFWVDTDFGKVTNCAVLKIWVGDDSKLFKKAQELNPGVDIVPGYKYAIEVKDVYSHYWISGKQK